ncbi:MAG: lipid-A-disaccharide synthase [Pseudomonadota bacterium]
MDNYSILLLAGEASGDHHAATLVKDLKDLIPGLKVTGIGGDKLAAAGMDLLFHYRDINTIALTEGFGKLVRILKVYRAMKAELMSGRHNLFIPVDYPDVNIRLCRFASRARIPVCYYISPQVWAWRKGRIRKIASRVDRMMTIFPFEERLYREAGLETHFVGHTMVREIPESMNRAELRAEMGFGPEDRVIALVPGSRQAEVRRMLPIMSEAAVIFHAANTDARFVLPLAAEHLRPIVEEIIEKYPLSVTVRTGSAFDVMAAADCGLVTSGTATLQAALAGMPHAVVYKVDPATWWIGLHILKPLLMDKDVHIAIANVLAIYEEREGRGPIKEVIDAGLDIRCGECGRPLFVPEILQDRAVPDNLAVWLTRMLNDEVFKETTAKGFRQIREMLRPPPHGPTAAEVVRDILAGRT